MAGIALAPYPTVLLPFQLALWVQGGIVVAILAALLVSDSAGLPRVVRDAPRAIRWGLGLYAGAAIWGAAVGLLSANPLRFVASQLASMLLIPAAFFAFCAGRRVAPRELAYGLGVAGVVALGVHTVAFFRLPALMLPPGEPLRFCLRNDVGFTGITVVALLVAVAWWRGERHWVAAAATLCLVALLVGSMSRGAWVAAVVGVAASTVLSGVSVRRTTLGLVLGLGAAIGGTAAAAHWVGARAERPVELSLPAAGTSLDPAIPSRTDARLVTGPGATGTWVPLGTWLPADASAVEVNVWLWGTTGTEADLWLKCRGETGDVLFSAQFKQNGCQAWAPLRLVLSVPAEVRSVEPWVSTSGGQWLVADLHVRHLRSAPEIWLRSLWLRLESAVTAVTKPGTEGTTRYRSEEWRAIRTTWATSGAWRFVFGHGLGATFAFPNSAWNAEGGRVTLPTASYIHSFFVFLGFKLGIAGVAALAGLALIAGWTTVEAVRQRRAPRPSWLVPAVAAGWLAYLVWSVTSPEILDFRVAPIWGALLAACALPRRTSPEEAHTLRPGD